MVKTRREVMAEQIPESKMKALLRLTLANKKLKESGQKLPMVVQQRVQKRSVGRTRTYRKRTWRKPYARRRTYRKRRW